jgi:hypothetical protein
MKRAIRTVCCAGILLAAIATAAEAAGPRRADVTRRHNEIADKRVPIETRELQRNSALNDKRMPVKMWHSEYSGIGQRRAAIDVSERREKTMIRPEIIETQTIDRRMAPMDGRIAFVRNFDRVQEKPLVPKYRDAEVGRVHDLGRPAPAKKAEEELSMREINRFSFHRNHPDEGGAAVQRPASGESDGRSR